MVNGNMKTKKIWFNFWRVGEHPNPQPMLQENIMVTRIKRIAQFLFDNADVIAEYLRQSDNFRTIEVDLRLHKAMHDIPEFDIGLLLYDETAKLHELKNHLIIKERFVQLQKMINEDCGVTPLPEHVEVRDELDKKREQEFRVGEGI